MDLNSKVYPENIIYQVVLRKLLWLCRTFYHTTFTLVINHTKICSEARKFYRSEHCPNTFLSISVYYHASVKIHHKVRVHSNFIFRKSIYVYACTCFMTLLFAFSEWSYLSHRVKYRLEYIWIVSELTSFVFVRQGLP